MSVVEVGWGGWWGWVWGWKERERAVVRRVVVRGLCGSCVV